MGNETNAALHDALETIGDLVDHWPRGHKMPRALAAKVDRVYDTGQAALGRMKPCKRQTRAKTTTRLRRTCAD